MNPVSTLYLVPSIPTYMLHGKRVENLYSAVNVVRKVQFWINITTLYLKLKPDLTERAFNKDSKGM
jgi:hypothetical protein